MEKDDIFVKASHNSGTGEPSKNIWHKLLVPFARCQSKTIAEQWQNDVRLFDIRIRLKKNSKFGHYDHDVICHGLWESKTSLKDVALLLTQINTHKESVHLIITYEGKPSAGEEYWFMDYVYNVIWPRWVTIDALFVKKPKWRCISSSKDAWTYLQHYTKIIGWKCLLPIPWLWNKINRFPVDNTDTEMRDFI